MYSNCQEAFTGHRIQPFVYNSKRKTLESTWYNSKQFTFNEYPNHDSYSMMGIFSLTPFIDKKTED
jgi:hypothetical protein